MIPISENLDFHQGKSIWSYGENLLINLTSTEKNAHLFIVITLCMHNDDVNAIALIKTTVQGL